MKKVYRLMAALLLISSPMFALRLYVKNETEKKLRVAVPDDKSAGNCVNAKEIKPGKKKVFTTTLLKSIKGPIRFAIAKKVGKDKPYTLYETPPGGETYFLPFSLKAFGDANRTVEIGLKDGKYAVRRIKNPGTLFQKKQKWVKFRKFKKKTDKDW